MKKVCFFASVLFISANVFGMYNNEASSSKNINSKRVMPYNQEFVSNKKHITLTDVFEKSSANELKRSPSDDMEVEVNDFKKNKVYHYKTFDFKKQLERESSFKRSDIGTFAHNMWLLPVDWLSPEAISRVMGTVVQGYRHILEVCNPEISLYELIKLDAMLAEDFRKAKEQLKSEGINFDPDRFCYSCDLSAYENRENLLSSKIRDYTNAVMSLPFLNGEWKKKLKIELEHLSNKRNDNPSADTEILIQELLKFVVSPGYRIKY